MKDVISKAILQWHKDKHIDQKNRKSLNQEFSVWPKICHMGDKYTMEKVYSVQQMMLEKLDINMQKEEEEKEEEEERRRRKKKKKRKNKSTLYHN